VPNQGAKRQADRRETQRVLDETFGVAPDFPYPDRSDWDRIERVPDLACVDPPQADQESQ